MEECQHKDEYVKLVNAICGHEGYFPLQSQEMKTGQKLVSTL